MSSNTLAEIGALMGDGARANMMSALMGGQALTASELAYRAGVTAQTTSGHLAKLTEAGLLIARPPGPPSLLPPGLAFGGAYAGIHDGGGFHPKPAALSPGFAHR